MKNMLKTFFVLTVLLSASRGAAPAAESASPKAGAPRVPTLHDGLKWVEFKWVELAAHKVQVPGVRGAIKLQAFLPEDHQLPEDKSLPFAYGVEIRITFHLKHESKTGAGTALSYSLTVPRRARKSLKPLQAGGIINNIQQKIEGVTQTVQGTISANYPWFLSFPVTNKMTPGKYSYAISLGGQVVARGAYSFRKLSRVERDTFQRQATVFFFGREAFPRFHQWVADHDGRMPKIKEFLNALKTLNYFPANDYTARRGMPKRFEHLRDPANIWLAKEVRTAYDGNVVVCYADGSIGLENPEEEKDRRWPRRRRR